MSSRLSVLAGQIGPMAGRVVRAPLVVKVAQTGKPGNIGQGARVVSFGLPTLGLSVALAVSAAAQSISPPNSYEPVDANGVDLASGSFSISTSTISIGPTQGGLSYRASSAAGTNAWRHSTAGGVDRRPLTGTGAAHPVYTVTVMGRSATFISDGSGGFQRQDGLGTLTFSGAVYTYTAPDGSIAYISKALSTLSPYAANEGQITLIERPNGERITFTYNSAKQIQAISNNLGYQLHFEYTGANPNFITTATAFNMGVDSCAPTSLTCSYSQAWPRLTFAETKTGSQVTARTVTDSLGRYMRLLYGGGVLTGVERPNRANISIAWHQGKVRTFSNGTGSWTYTFEAGPPTRYVTTTKVIDPMGQATLYAFDWLDVGEFGVNFTTRLKSITNPYGVMTNVIQGGGGLGEVTFAEGNGSKIFRNEDGNVVSVLHFAKPGSGLASVSTTAVYPATSSSVLGRRPTSISDTQGNVTDYTYDAAGNLLTETGPAAVPGGPRPQTRYVWEQRYAWYKQNGASAITQAATPVWVQVSQSQCMTGATC